MNVIASRDLRIDLLDERHDRTGFSCGDPCLDRYFETEAGADVQRKTAAVFVLLGSERPTRILGYYVIRALCLHPGMVTAAARGYPRHDRLDGVALIERLAIAKAHQGRRLGGLLLADALRRSAASAGTIGASMIMGEAASGKSAGFYEAHGFVRLPDSQRLIWPLRTMKEVA